MSNHKQLRELFKKMTGQDNMLTIPKLFVEYLDGDLTTALVLNQIVFYSDKSKRDDGFFFKTKKEWQEETGLTSRRVSYSTDKLEKLGVVKTELKKANGAPVVHYQLDFDKLLNLICTKCEIPIEQSVENPDFNKVSKTLTDDTQLNTTDEQIKNLRARYSDYQLQVIDHYFDALKKTRKTNKISDNVILNIYKKWEQYETDRVIYGLNAHLQKTPDKQENYTLGIIRNATGSEIKGSRYGQKESKVSNLIEYARKEDQREQRADG